MLSKKVKGIFIVASIILIISVLGFTGMLNINSFQENYVDSLVSSHAVVARETVRKIEYAVKYGKPLDNFHGIDQMLQKLKQQLPEIDNAYIILSDGSYTYDMQGRMEERKLSSELMVHFDLSTSFGSTYERALEGENYYLFLPIRDKEEVWLGNLAIVFSKAIVQSKVQVYTYSLLKYLVFLAGIAAIVLLLVNAKVSFLTDAGVVKRKVLLTIILTVLGTVQVFYGFINYLLFKEAYIDIARESTYAVTSIIQEDIQSVVTKGVPYSKLYEIEDYMKKIISSVSEVEEIYLSTQESQRLEETNESLTYQLPLIEDAMGEQATINVTISEAHLQKRLREIVLDTLTVLVTSTFFMVELTFFLLIFLSKQVQNSEKQSFDTESTEDVMVIRTLAFIVFIAIFMSSAFIPVLMKNIYRPIGGLSENVVLGLPISANFLFGAMATVMAGSIIEKRGWKSTFFLGAGLLGIGTLFSGITTNPLMFIGIRGLTGAGYGFTLMAMRGFVLSIPNGKDGGFASLNAGIYSGMNCGVVIGAMLADRIGYKGVFYLTVGIVVIAGIFALLFITDTTTTNTTKNQNVIGKGSVKKFLLNPHILIFFLCILIPTATCTMFLDYFFPLFARELEISISNIGRAFLLNGLCIVYLGPILTKYSGKYLGVKKSLTIGAIITAVAMLVFALKGTLMAAFTTALLLGIADSFGLVAQTNHLLGLKASKELGEGLALGYYSNIKKIGQMLGPIIFGSAIALGNTTGVGLIGIGFLITITLFLLTSRSRKAEVDKSYNV